MVLARKVRLCRTGGVYIAVLGTAMIISLLGLAALTAQRIQNRVVTASADIRQAQLNANTAVELAILAMSDEDNWRTVRPNGNWFTNRATTIGTCTANVTDPIDGNLAGNSTDPVVVLGIGYSGDAEQRVKVTVDAFAEPLTSLRSAVAAGDTIDLQGDTLRTGGLITANTMSATSAQVYGSVEAVSVSGSTYNGTTTTVNSAKRPTMPDWGTVFDYYRNNGTELSIGSLPEWSAMNLGKQVDIESGISSWTGTSPSGLGTATISQSNNQNHTASGTYSLRVQSRSDWYAGACQTIDSFVKPGQEYYIEAYVWLPLLVGVLRDFHFTLYTKGSGSFQLDDGPDTSVLSLGWRKVSATLTAPSWSGNLQYAFIKIAGANSTNTSDFYVDDLIIRETTTGKIVYQKLLSPSVNTFYTGAPTNASQGKTHGIYWIDCNGNKLVIERSRILGTLLIVNPGAGSCIAEGPIHWAPAVAGYPALLVDADTATAADFAINATNRGLSEKENGVNFNPAGAAHSQFGEDIDTSDIYPSEIYGLVAIGDDLSYQNSPLIRGQVLTGDDISNSSGTLEVEFNPESLLNPPPGFLAPNSFERRPASAIKVVLP
jgi:hypothetical protein